MKAVATEGRLYYSSGFSDSAAFSIKPTAKAFRILIDGLYSNKILAGVREVMSNALDSHARKGCLDRPIMVWAPHGHNPEFVVRDFGVSMTHDEVMNTYTKVFESTKEDTNDEVGALGLGSKSPFAYTDTFQVTCWSGGQKREYVAVIDGRGFPRIESTDPEPSKEESGVEIRYAVKSSDVYKFQSAITAMAFGLKTKPIIHGMGSIAARTEPDNSGSGWETHSSMIGWPYSGAARIRQGWVTYPLDVNALEIQDQSLERAASIIGGSRAIIDMPIGTCDIAASREALSYNDETRAAITAKLKAIVSEISEKFKTEMASLRTPWERAERFNDHWNTVGFREIFTAAWNEIPAGHKLPKHGHYLLSGTICSAALGRARGSIVAYQGSGSGKSYGRISRNGTEIYPRLGQTHVFWVDPKARVSHLQRRLAHGLTSRNAKAIVINAAPGSMNYKRAMVLLGRPNAKPASSLALPPSLQVERKPPPPNFRLITKDGIEKVRPDDIDMKKVTHAILLQGGDPVMSFEQLKGYLPDDSVILGGYIASYRKLIRSGIKDAVLAVKEAALDRLDPKFIDETFAISLMKESQNWNRQTMILARIYDESFRYVRDEVLTKIIAKLGKDHPLAKLKSRFTVPPKQAIDQLICRNTLEAIEHIEAVQKKRKVRAIKATKEFNERHAKVIAKGWESRIFREATRIQERYPMLSCVIMEEHIGLAVEYVRSIDSRSRKGNTK